MVIPKDISCIIAAYVLLGVNLVMIGFLGGIMSYTALYRKFRPGDFEEVKGQDHIVTTLRNQIRRERIGHAYLFCGTRGTGKTTLAKIMAKAVNCEHTINGSPCNQCEMCRKINSQTSMNVVEIDAASNNGVSNIREIIDEVQYSPTEGKYKVYIIDEVHMLSTGAFNALLKTLEEPPSYVIFILATTEAHKIPITILSRCQRYDFKRISIDTIADRMRELVSREKIEVEEKALRYIAKMADGSMRDGLSLLDQCIAFYMDQKLTYDNALEVLGAVDISVYSKMYNNLISYNAVGCIEVINDMMIAGRDISQFINEFIWYLRNLMLLSSSESGSEMVDVSEEQLAVMKDEAKKVDVEVLMRYIRILSELSGQIRYSTQKRVMIEVTFIKLCKPQMDKVQDMTTITSRLDAIERMIESGSIVQISENQKVSPEISDRESTADKSSDIMLKAVPEDIREVVKRWREVIAKCDRVEQTMLMNAKKVAADDGSLILQFTDAIDEGYFKRDNQKQLECLKVIIQNIIGKEVSIQTRLVSEETNDRFADISELINFEDIEYK